MSRKEGREEAGKVCAGSNGIVLGVAIISARREEKDGRSSGWLRQSRGFGMLVRIDKVFRMMIIQTQEISHGRLLFGQCR